MVRLIQQNEGKLDLTLKKPLTDLNECFGFGTGYINWINLFYINAKLR